MADYAHRMTDQELAQLEERIEDVYYQAYQDMVDMVDDYFDEFLLRDEETRLMVESGDMSEWAYKQWRINQIGRGERYQQMATVLSNRYTHANEIATSYINDKTPGIYSLNRNYSAYTMEQYSPDLDFTLFDEPTMKRLLMTNPSLMPHYPEQRAIDRGIDLAYGQEQIQASITSGILQGKSLPSMANDLMDRVTDMNETSAKRAAKTAFTNAENGGRQDAYEDAEDMGLDMEKVWLSTLDSRTREAHQQADMQRVKPRECFIVGGERLLFPGDTEHGASGWNLYNCRCSMFEKPKDMKLSEFKRWARNPETGKSEYVTGKSYSEWLKEKENENTLLYNRG